MKNHQLRALVAVAEHGSIRAAARSLSLSQTALTKSLRELEIDLGAALLNRSPQGVRLTVIGLDLLRHAKLILSQMDEARSSVQALLGQGTQRLTAAVTPAFSVLCLPNALERFRHRFPNARVSIRDAFLSHTLPMLREGTVDVAVTAVLPDVLGNDLHFEPLGNLLIALSGPRQATPRKPCRLADLSEVPWLLDSSRGGISEAVLQWRARHHVPAPQNTIECPSSMASLVLSTQYGAIAPVPRAMLSIPWIAAIAQEIELEEELPRVPLGIVLRKDGQLDAPAQWFVECVRLALRDVVLEPPRPQRQIVVVPTG